MSDSSSIRVSKSGLVSLFLFLVLSSFIDASPSVASAEDLPQTKISSTAYKANLDLQFQASLTSRDYGLRRGHVADPVRLSQLKLNLLRLGFRASGVQTDIRFELDLNRVESGEVLRTAFVDTKLNRIVSLRIGQDELLMGGWEQKEPAHEQVALSTYRARGGRKYGAPLEETAPAATAAFNIGDSGDLLFQVTDDVTRSEDSEISSFNSNTAQPALLVQFIPVTGPVLPLVQVGTYDINHSKFLQVGVKADIGRLHSFADYLLDLREIGSEGDRSFQRINSVVFYLAYDLKNALRPFIKGDVFESRLETETIPANPNPLVCEDHCYPKQGNQLTVGAWFATPSPYLRPYVSYTQRSGRFIRERLDISMPDSLKRESIAQFGLSGHL